MTVFQISQDVYKPVFMARLKRAQCPMDKGLLSRQQQSVRVRTECSLLFLASFLGNKYPFFCSQPWWMLARTTCELL